MSILIDKSVTMSIVNEAYYGKPKEFEIIEQELEKIIRAVNEEYDNDKSSIKSTNINSSDSVVTIEKLFKKVFKVKDVNLTFYSITGPSYNAFAMPKALTVLHRSSKDNMRANPDKLLVNISVDKMLLIHGGFTAKEIMALMLHEIGHSFDASYFMMMANVLPSVGIKRTTYSNGDQKISWFVSAKEYLSQIASVALSQLGLSHYTTKINKAIEQVVEKIPRFGKFMATLGSISTSIRLCISTIGIANLIKNPILIIYRIIQPRNIFGYGAEKYADSFATAYGYGNDLSTAMAKTDKRSGLLGIEAIRKVPVVNVMYNFAEVCIDIISMPTDPHPKSAVRILAQLKKLKRELDDPDVPENLKNELREQIAEQEEIIKNFTDKDYVENEGRIFSVIWNKFLIDVTDGKLDPRELMELVARHEE